MSTRDYFERIVSRVFNKDNTRKLVYINTKIFEHSRDTELGRINLERMRGGKSALDSTNREINLHHIGRKHTSNLVTISEASHRKYYNQLHNLSRSKSEKVNRSKFSREKSRIWRDIYGYLEGKIHDKVGNKPIKDSNKSDKCDIKLKKKLDFFA